MLARLVFKKGNRKKRHKAGHRTPLTSNAGIERGKRHNITAWDV